DLLGVQAGGVAVLEADVDRRAVGRRQRAAGLRVERGVERRVDGVGAGVQRERQRLRRLVVLDELLRLALLVAILLQLPALEPRAAVGEHRDDVQRFDAHVTLGGIADERRGGRRLGRGRLVGRLLSGRLLVGWWLGARLLARSRRLRLRRLG